MSAEAERPGNLELIRPRLTEAYDVFVAQEDVSFAIPFLGEDVPLYLDPFLLWRSPSQQDNSLHELILGAFNHLGWLASKGRRDEAVATLVAASECDEIGLGNSRSRVGKRVGVKKAGEVIDIFERLPAYSRDGFQHIEEAQLYVDGISKDRISDISANVIKSFLIDYTMDECDRLGIPRSDVRIPLLYKSKTRSFIRDELVSLPISPNGGRPIILVPKRWLRHVPWINFDDYFTSHCPQDDLSHAGVALDRVEILKYNRENFGQVKSYVEAKERTADECRSDPLFSPVPVTTVKRHLKRLSTLRPGNTDGDDKEYEKIMEAILPSMLYPELDFATSQSRTASGVSIRDLVFFNTKGSEFLKDMGRDYDCKQIVFELKNVKAIESQHIDQINRYLSPSLSKFGLLVTRNRMPSARMKQAVDLWSGQRKCVLVLDDEDINMMGGIFESKQRRPIDVIKKKYFEFMQKVPV